MIDFTLVLFINSLAIIGICQATKYGMILHPLILKLDKILPNWIRKPLYYCPACMASIHWWVVLFFIESIQQLNFLPVYVLALSGMNILLNTIVIYIEFEEKI